MKAHVVPSGLWRDVTLRYRPLPPVTARYRRAAASRSRRASGSRRCPRHAASGTWGRVVARASSGRASRGRLHTLHTLHALHRDGRRVAGHLASTPKPLKSTCCTPYRVLHFPLPGCTPYRVLHSGPRAWSAASPPRLPPPARHSCQPRAASCCSTRLRCNRCNRCNQCSRFNRCNRCNRCNCCSTRLRCNRCNRCNCCSTRLR